MNADALAALASEIAAAVPGAAQTLAFGEITLQVAPAEIVATLTALRDHPVLRFTTLIDICGADYPERAQRFDVVYHLLSMRRNARVRVKLQTGEMQPVPTTIGVYPASKLKSLGIRTTEALLEAARPGGDRRLAERWFDEAIARSGGRLPNAYLAKAEALALPAGDRQGFEQLLQQALATSPPLPAAQTLAAEVARRRAAWLLLQSPDLF